MQSHYLFSHLLLHHVSGLGPAKQKRARKFFDCADDLIHQPISFWRHKVQLSPKGCSQIQQWLTDRQDSELAKKVSSDIEWLNASEQHHILSQDCPAFPELLKNIYDPPPVLYLMGQISCLTSPKLAIVGARKATRYGLDSAYYLSQKVSQQGWVVVSGLAQGIDGVAHEACIQLGLPTMAVLGCGVDIVYPKNHYKLSQDIKQTGLIVSEFPLGTLPRPGYFPQRNRIISGLCQGTLVVEAEERSGSLITAQMALDEGREVFATPGSIFNPLARGCHRLIQQGAKLIMDDEDLLVDLSRLHGGMTQPLQDSTALPMNIENFTSEEASVVYDQLSSDPVSCDELMVLASLDHSKILAALLELELLQLVATVPGGYCRVR